VHDLLTENGLGQFYSLNPTPGNRVRERVRTDRFAYLNDAEVQQKLLDFDDGKLSRVTLHVPSVHCVACVWLLENLYQLHAGLGRSQVNFPKREVSISFDPRKIKLGELATLLASIGYEPQFTLGTLEKPIQGRIKARQWLQLGIAGFAFGNIMLFALPGYIGLDSVSGPMFSRVFGYLSLAIALPVLLYSAADYWKTSWFSLRQRRLTLDVPIAVGLLALYLRSAWEILSGAGEGYLDSLSGLVFLLLCGRAFQQITHERLAFDRDYKCFFPLSVTRVRGGVEESVAVSKIEVGDRLRLRNRELLPADSTLVCGDGLIDYSFVTGEANPLKRGFGDYLYAGGRQAGQMIEVQTVKPVSQSYLTSLWDDEAFRKDRDDTLDTLTNRFARYFTPLVIAVAMGAAAHWMLVGDTSRAINAFTSVLIVACPCALALAAPFALGTGQRLLARAEVFVRNSLVIERLGRITAIAFDKTGTLTGNTASGADFHAPAGTQASLNAREACQVSALARQSTHPLAMRICASLSRDRSERVNKLQVQEFSEMTGCGLRGRIGNDLVRLGSAAWLNSTTALSAPNLGSGSHVHLEINGQYRGAFVLGNAVRAHAASLLSMLARDYDLSLISGDNEKEREVFRQLFPGEQPVLFHQSPKDKLVFVKQLQASGHKVMMVGDGLNDAGAFRQSDVGVAVVENVGVFSPASDVILPAAKVGHVSAVLALAKRTNRIIHLCFRVSSVYNLIGISIAAAGYLSPLICAVLMPISSVSVVLVACGATKRAARKEGIWN
jgi:Cu+-exporting ATPase